MVHFINSTRHVTNVAVSELGDNMFSPQPVNVTFEVEVHFARCSLYRQLMSNETGRNASVFAAEVYKRHHH